MILVIVGPTAVGKTKLSVELAKIYNGEVINADSTQVYKGLDVGTAKVTKEEMQHIPHHLFSFKEVTEDYSVFDYQKDARACIEEIKSRGKIPILVGGTGFYLKAALYDYEFQEEKAEVSENYDDLSDEVLRNRIEAYETGVSYDVHNRQRMIRLLAKLDQGWYPEEKSFTLQYSDVIFIGLTTDREVLYQKINARFDQMVVPLIDEIKPFIIRSVPSRILHTAIGYKEFYPFFENQKTLREVIEEVKKNTRNYAKRQYTWFLNQMDVTWFNVNYDHFDKTIQEVAAFIDTLQK
ncbi:MAG: tRNA (adenosine(37)-N6)-dimethylallyltransferase MiaA [Bacilli bacterium]|nr:tRNA (adenosine(37)-N6)-dimethylallyltransferase MiaA [Bacilli bacterium]